MRLYLLLFLAVVNGGISTYRPWEESPCEMVNMDVFCKKKGLQQIPWEFHPDIKKIDFSNNLLQNLTETPLTFYTLIQNLDLSSNQIKFIQSGIFMDMKNLKMINLSENFLGAFVQHNTSGIGPLPYVTSLDLSSNSLHTGMAEPFLENAPSLQHLSLSGNSIMMIAQKMFLGTPVLAELNLHNNVIMDIEEGAFEHLSQLLKLDLSMNSITCISDFSLHQLQVLDLSQNSIETFHTAASEEEFHLLAIDLSENNLLHFPILPKFNHLKYVNASKNLIKLGMVQPADGMEYFENDWLESPFQTLNQSQDKAPENPNSANLSKLIHLDLSYNRIESILHGFFDTMSSLQFLNLSRNCLQEFVLGPNNPLSSLVTFDLSHNSLHNFSVTCDTLTSLKYLYLQNNNIHLLDPNIFQGFPSIQLLDLRSNTISICSTYSAVAKDRLGGGTGGCASFFRIPKLAHLHLSDNMISILPKDAFQKTPLAVLDLSLNPELQIKAKALSGLEPSLEYLHLQGNNLTVLNIDLHLFLHLKHLNLSGNHLTWLPAWSGACSLESLDLRKNRFSSLQASDIPVLEKTLQVLYLKGNPLSCCGNVWLSHMIQRATVKLPDLELVTCEHSQSFGYLEDLPVSQIRPLDCEKEDLKKTNLIIVLTFVLLLSAVVIGVGSFCCFRRQRFNRQLKPLD
ncbi:transforming growth factor beta activator LRRC32 [Ambystoma mexicanum]|uniref:transforming growth factor beta activator LRRC32 n=1 Tax=Ambystoma mexicanum TaxID=8296 RepID=UPI0037E962C3